MHMLRLDVGLRVVDLDVGKYLREAWAIPGNSLRWVSLRHSLPHVVVHGLPIEVDKILLAGSAGHWT